MLTNQRLNCIPASCFRLIPGSQGPPGRQGPPGTPGAAAPRNCIINATGETFMCATDTGNLDVSVVFIQI